MDTQNLTRHQRNRLRTRKQLQTALLELSLEKGFGNVSIQDITDRADVARATFYLHARDKDELLWSLIADTIHQTEQELSRNYTGTLPPQAEYYGYRNIFEHVEHHRDLYRVILSKNGSPEMYSRVHDYLVSESLKDMQSLGIYAEIQQPPEITAQIVVGSILSLAIWWLETPNSYTPAQMAAMLYQALHHRQPPVDAF